MNSQSAFALPLLNSGLPCPGGLKSWNNSDPATRYAVYRNNVTVSLIDALADVARLEMARVLACHAAGQASAQEAAFDLSAALAVLLRWQLITTITTDEENHAPAH